MAREKNVATLMAISKIDGGIKFKESFNRLLATKRIIKLRKYPQIK
jgi:hypothetical protein